MPLPRTEVAGAQSHGFVMVVGGMTSNGRASDRADLYEPDRNAWIPLPRLPVALHHTAVASLNHRLYVVGGYTIDNAPSDGVWSFGLGEHMWRDEPRLPAGRAAHAVAVVNDALIVIGGVFATGVTNSTLVYRAGQGWRDGPPLARAREHLAATSAGGRAYAIAGRANGVNFTDVESWDGVDTASWRVEPPLNDSRGGIGADEIRDQPCVVGGEQPAGTIASVECLRDGRWQRVARLAIARHGVAVAAVGNVLHVIGGGTRPGLSVSATHEALAL